MCDEYNGWSNKFTWLVSLWLDNELYTSDYLMQLSNNEGLDLYEKVNMLQEFTEEIVQSQTSYQDNANMSTDLIGTALAWVNYNEIVDAHIDEDYNE